MSFTATARSIDGTLRHEIDVNGRHTITTDEPESLGGTDTAPARTSSSPRRSHRACRRWSCSTRAATIGTSARLALT